MFFKCPKDRDGGQCNFFEWEDQPGSGMQKAISPQQLRGPPLGGAYQPRAEEGAPQGSCFKCGQVLTAAAPSCRPVPMNPQYPPCAVHDHIPVSRVDWPGPSALGKHLPLRHALNSDVLSRAVGSPCSQSLQAMSHLQSASMRCPAATLLFSPDSLIL